MKRLWIAATFGLFALPSVLFLVKAARAQEESAYIAVGKAKVRKTVVALPPIAGEGTVAAAAKSVFETVKRDLQFMDSFEILGESAYLDKSANIAPGSFKLTDWSSIGAEFVLKAAAAANERGFQVEVYLYNSGSGATPLVKRYIAALGETATLGHTLANDVVQAITGTRGIFDTKIAMVCDRTKKKEVYAMDFDGSNVKQLTQHKSVTLSPAWSPDGHRIAYSLIAKNKRNVKNTNLYEFNLDNSTIKMLSDRQGINSGAHYHPDGKRIALTMSFLGDPEIFVFDPVTKSVTRLTHSPGVDVDPNWSPDGKQISFVSSRSGQPMVYKMNADGSGVQRLTFAGRYNATPAWSPKNDKIAFAGWLDGHFDIFLINVDGTNIERLTKNQGNNEDPAFSPDGNFVLFSSNRAGSKNIYVMNVEGTFVRRLTYGLGNCVSPRWSGAAK